MSPVTAATLRIILAWVALSLYALIRKKSTSLPPKSLPIVWLTGIFAQGLPFALLFYAEKSVSAGFAGLMNGTAPLWSFVIGLAFLKNLETFTARKFAGIILGFVGVLVIFWPNLNLEQSANQVWGALAALGMALCYGLSFAMNRHLLAGKKKLNLFATLYHQEIGSLVFLLPVLILSGELKDTGWVQNWEHIIWAQLYLGVLSTAIGAMVYLWLIREWGMIRSSMVVYIVPLAAVIFDILIYKNLPHVLEITGGLIVLSSVLLVQDNNPIVQWLKVRKAPAVLVTR